MPGYYPAYLNIEGRRCIVVGGGKIAERKVESLLECGAVVTVISPHLSPVLQKLCDSSQIEVVRRRYLQGDLARAFVVVAATDDESVNARVSGEALENGALVNVADDPKRSNFIVPAVIRRGDLVVSISTGGRSPALAKKLRGELERTLVPEYESLLSLVAEVREQFKCSGKNIDPGAWQETMDAELLDLLRRGLVEQARARLISSLRRYGAAADV